MRATAGPLLLAFAAGLTALLAHPAQAADADGALVKDDKVHVPSAETVEQAGTALGTSLKSLAPRDR